MSDALMSFEPDDTIPPPDPPLLQATAKRVIALLSAEMRKKPPTDMPWNIYIEECCSPSAFEAWVVPAFLKAGWKIASKGPQPSGTRRYEIFPVFPADPVELLEDI